MFEAEGQIAGLEAGAIAPAQNVQLHAFGCHRHGIAHQRGMIVVVAIVQKLNGEAVLGPVHRGGGFGDPYRQQTFIADRQLHQHMRQFVFAERRARQFGTFAEYPDPGQNRQLGRKRTDGDKDAAQSKLQGEGKTVHVKLQAPEAKWRNCGIFRIYEYAGSSRKGHPRRPGARHGPDA